MHVYCVLVDSIANDCFSRPYSPLSPASNPCSPDTPDRSHSATPGLEIPNMDLLTELKDLLKFEPDKMENCDSPPIDRSVNILTIILQLFVSIICTNL